MHCHVIISVFSEKPEDEMNNYKKERKKMKKKVFAAFCAAAMAFTAAGCSGGNQASSEPVEVASVEDLAELNIGVQIGTTGDSAATEAVNEDSQVNRFNKGADAIQALKNGNGGKGDRASGRSGRRYGRTAKSGGGIWKDWCEPESDRTVLQYGRGAFTGYGR